MQRTASRLAAADRPVRHYHMIQLILTLSFVLIAWPSVLSNAGTPSLSHQPTRPVHQAQGKDKAKEENAESAPLPVVVKKRASKPAPTENYTYNYTYNYQTPKPFDWPAWLQAVGTVALALLAIGQIYFLNRTMRATRQAASAAEKSATVAESSLKVAERAWLSVALDHPFQPRVGHMTPIEFTVRNIGKTVAILKAKKINAKMWDSSCIPQRQLDQKPTGVLPTIAVIFPGDALTLDGLVDIAFTQDQIDGPAWGNTIFDVYGYIAYDDVFGARHITRFCQVYNARTRGFDFPREAQPSYNDAD